MSFRLLFGPKTSKFDIMENFLDISVFDDFNNKGIGFFVIIPSFADFFRSRGMPDPWGSFLDSPIIKLVLGTNWEANEISYPTYLGSIIGGWVIDIACHNIFYSSEGFLELNARVFHELYHIDQYYSYYLFHRVGEPSKDTEGFWPSDLSPKDFFHKDHRLETKTQEAMEIYRKSLRAGKSSPYLIPVPYDIDDIRYPIKYWAKCFAIDAFPISKCSYLQPEQLTLFDWEYDYTAV